MGCKACDKPNPNYRKGLWSPATMSTPGSRAMTIGLSVMLLSFSAAMHFDGFGLLLCFLVFLVGASLLAAGVRMTHGPSPLPMVFVRRNTAAVGLVTASCASTALSGKQDPVLSLPMFGLLLLGLTLVNFEARAE